MIIDKILDDKYDNDMYHNIMDEVIKFINLHYLNGSNFDTPFWQMDSKGAKELYERDRSH